MNKCTVMLANLQQPVRDKHCENREIPPGPPLFHNLVSGEVTGMFSKQSGNNPGSHFILKDWKINCCYVKVPLTGAEGNPRKPVLPPVTSVPPFSMFSVRHEVKCRDYLY